MQCLLIIYGQCQKSLPSEVSSRVRLLYLTMEGADAFFIPSGVELSALREEGFENSQARPLAWLVELFLD